MQKREVIYTLKAFLDRVLELQKSGAEINTSETSPIPGGYYNLVFSQDSSEAVEADADVVKEQKADNSDDAADEPQEGSTDLEVLESLTKKAELLDFASGKSIEVPEEMTQPAAIKKFLKENI